MITPNEQLQWQDKVATYTTVYYGLSTDEKPIEGVANGSCFIEMDTSNIYFFDLENLIWIKWGA